MPSAKARHRVIVLMLAMAAAAVAARAGQDPAAPESVVVVANSAVGGSLTVARAYLARRAIPEKNLIVLETSAEQRIPRKEYVETIHNPLLAALVERGLVNAIGGRRDSFGRDSVVVIASPVRYVVLCYGVPLSVIEQPLETLEDTPQRRAHLTGPNAALVKTFAEGPMARNEASVDGELALLLKRDVPFTGFYPNPLYNNRLPDTTQDLLRVTRLDGPSPDAVIRMLDNALAGERNGLKGRAYIDEDGRGGDGYEVGNQWMARAATIFAALGFDLTHNTARETIRADERFDAPVLYAGWYAHNIEGPFTLPGFRFPAGAVVAHLHSFSAADLRSPTKGWVGPFVERGVSATVGNVAEPYLTLTHNFDLFFAALADGWNFADAAYFALPGLSWQAVAVGDPLYRPFATGLDEQVERMGDPARILEDQYVAIRRILKAEKEGRRDEALALAARGMRETPGPALALVRARLLLAAGERDQARTALGFLASLPPSGWSNWGLYAEIADTLNELGDAKAALRIYQNLEKQKIPDKVLLAILKRGIKVAQDAGEPGIAVAWQTRVTPPPPPPPPAAPAEKP